MRFTFFIATLVVSTPIARAFCPSPRVDADVIKRAIEYEAVKRNSLIARDNINIDIYLHNVARGATWDEGYVSVSPGDVDLGLEFSTNLPTGGTAPEAI